VPQRSPRQITSTLDAGAGSEARNRVDFGNRDNRAAEHPAHLFEACSDRSETLDDENGIVDVAAEIPPLYFPNGMISLTIDAPPLSVKMADFFGCDRCYRSPFIDRLERACARALWVYCPVTPVTKCPIDGR
jgi:hypothetical protein